MYKCYYKDGVYTKTWYVKDAQGNTLAVYGNKPTEPSSIYWNEQHLYGSTRLGMWTPSLLMSASINSSTVWSTDGLKLYELSNHLGNVLVVISNKALPQGSPMTHNLAELKSVQDYYPFGMMMPGRKFANNYRYGFNGQEKSTEVGENNYTAQFWEYDSRIGRRWNVDPVVFSDLSPYSVFDNKPIILNDPNGDCPTCKGGNETYVIGTKVGNKDGKWEYLGDHRWKTIELNLGNSTPDFKEYYNNAGGAATVDQVGNDIYIGKLRAYNDNFARGIYGSNADGTVAVPISITNRLRNEANAEAFNAFKTSYAVNTSGIDPSSISFMFNPLARVNYYSSRARAVTSYEDGSDLLSDVALEVGISWAAQISMIKNTPALKVERIYNQKNGQFNGLHISGGGFEEGIGIKLLRNKNGRVNGFSISKGTDYGSKPRFDFHTLDRASAKERKLTIPRIARKFEIPLPHYHTGKGNSLRYHRPLEVDRLGQRKW
ncbi:RHS repeat-associated protein [Chitinophaga skermanii]|uniref:RHS repeat-associated protein n=1 Tax=Chitinophaga skermanii TaxID=331697 RepID=A0A327QXS9_9BACT|nr:RHS repeat-associated core domain-containing protein [Chitinophaga skermanii]RAJ08775.1 RHS repeat-associated protein [Chitinophaga skermanii]